MTRAALLTTSLLLLIACESRVPVTDGGSRDGVSPRTSDYTLNKGQLDILYVMTVGNSTYQLREWVADALPSLVAGLRASLGTELSLRIGVTSSEVGAGPYQPAECIAPAGRLILSPRNNPGACEPALEYLTLDASNTNITTVDGDSVERLRKIVRCRSNTSGCSPFGNVAPLEASRLALADRNPTFLRKDASLLVIFVADTIDCSVTNFDLFGDRCSKTQDLGPCGEFRCFEYGMSCNVNDRTIEGPRTNCVDREGWLHPTERYVSFLKNLKPQGRVILAAVGGSVDNVYVSVDSAGTPYLRNGSTCYEGGSMPALRLHLLLSRFPPVLFNAKCNYDAMPYHAFFEQVGREAGRRSSIACLPRGPADSCRVEGQSDEAYRPLLRCETASSTNCWTTAPEESCSESGMRLVLNGLSEERVRLTCL